MLRALLLLLSVALASPWFCLCGLASPSMNGQWVMGYYVGYQANALPIGSIDWSGLTHIAMSPLTVTSALTLDTSFNEASAAAGAANAKALAAAAHANGVKALLMLGGAGAGANIATAAKPANLPAFVGGLTTLMMELGYDGFDLDWEDSVNLSDLVALAAALRSANQSIILTYPGGMINGNLAAPDPLLAQLALNLDRYFVQSYYPSTLVAGYGWESWFSSPISGVTSSTPIAIDDTLNRLMALGIPRSKLGFGIGAYAVCYLGTPVVTGPRQTLAYSGGNSIGGGDNEYPSTKFFASGGTFDLATGTERMRDSVTGEPYLSLSSPTADAQCGGSTQFISYEDEVSIIAKGNFSIQNGFGGIIIWTLAQLWLPVGAAGGRAQNSLFQALHQGFIAPSGSVATTPNPTTTPTTSTTSTSTTTATTTSPLSSSTAKTTSTKSSSSSFSSSSTTIATTISSIVGSTARSTAPATTTHAPTSTSNGSGHTISAAPSFPSWPLHFTVVSLCLGWMLLFLLWG